MPVASDLLPPSTLRPQNSAERLRDQQGNPPPEPDVLARVKPPETPQNSAERLKVQQETAAKLQTFLNRDPEIDPAKHAEAITVAKREAVPVGTAYNNLDGYRAQQKTRDELGIAQPYPATKKMMADPVWGPVTRDDVANMTTVERILSSMHGAWSNFDTNDRASILAQKKMYDKSFSTQDEAELNKALDEQQSQAVDYHLNPEQQVPAVMVASGRSMLMSAWRGQVRAGGWMHDYNLPSAASPFVVMGGSMFEMGKDAAGTAYNDLASIRDEYGKPLTHEAKTAIATVEGIITGAIELAPLEEGIKTIPGVSGAIRYGERVAGAALAKAIATRPLLRQTAERMGQLIATGGTEAMTQIVEDGWQIAGELIYGGKTDNGEDIKPKALGTIVKNGLIAFLAGVGYSVPGTAAGTVMDVRDAFKHKAMLKQLGEAIANSNIAKLSPDALTQHILNIKDQPNVPQHVTAPAEAVATLFQSEEGNAGKPIGPVIEKQFPELAKALDKSEETGAEVVIPLETFAKLTQMKGYNTFLDDVRVNSTGFSVNEAKKADAELNASVTGMFAETKAANPGATSHAIIKNAWKQKLIAVGQSPEAADVQADYFAERAVQEFTKAGIDPVEGLKRYGLQISSTVVDAAKMGPHLDAIRIGQPELPAVPPEQGPMAPVFAAVAKGAPVNGMYSLGLDPAGVKALRKQGVKVHTNGNISETEADRVMAKAKEPPDTTLQSVRSSLQAAGITVDQLQHLTNEQAVEAISQRTLEQGPLDVLYQRVDENTPGFHKYTEGLPVIEREDTGGHNFQSGVGFVAKLLHGTTGLFEVFDKMKGSFEADMGARFYFSNSADDVSYNYAGLGPDLKAKIYAMSERIETEAGEDPFFYAKIKKMAAQLDITVGNAITKMAMDHYVQHMGLMMPVYVKMKNPAVIGGKGQTILTYNIDENDVETGLFVDFIKMMDKVSQNYDIDPVRLSDLVYELHNEQAIGGLRLSEAIDTLRNSDAIRYLNDSDGNYVAGEFVREILEGLGYDGIVDRTVNRKFGTKRRDGIGMRGVDEGTIHFIAFEPTQIKSVFNRGTYDVTDPNIMFQRVEPGGTIEPTTPPASEQDITNAKADTRKGGAAVNARLPIIVPEKVRVHTMPYTVGAPGGGLWSKLSEKVLGKRGKGVKITQHQLDRVMEDTLKEVSAAAREAMVKTGAHFTMTPAQLNKAMQLPLSAQLWYELSGERFRHGLPDLTDEEHMMFVDLIGATSARSGPYENLARSLAIMSQVLRNEPIDVDLGSAGGVGMAYNRAGKNVSNLDGNKTGQFSNTLALVGGAPVPYPIPINDTWVGRMFGIEEETLSKNQSLHEVMALFQIKLAKMLNEQSPSTIPHQPWHLQARSWVQMRAHDAGIDTAGDFAGSDYSAEWPKAVERLRAAGIPVSADGVITRENLLDPHFAGALRPTMAAYQDATKATIELGTTRTPAGRRVADLLTRSIDKGVPQNIADYLKTITSAIYNSARGKPTMWQNMARAITGRSVNINRIGIPSSTQPFAVSGSFEGELAPNIRIPLIGLSNEEITIYNAAVGRALHQAAMASSRVVAREVGDPIAPGHIDGLSLFVAAPVDEARLRAFAAALPKGHEISTRTVPNGHVIDINPRFDDNGPVGIDEKGLNVAIAAAYSSTSHKVFHHDYSSVYTEAQDYDGVVHNFTEGLSNAAKQELTALGVKERTAERIIAAKNPEALLRSLPSNVRGRAATVAKRLRGRLYDFASAQKEFEALSQHLNASWEALAPTMEQRLQQREASIASELNQGREKAVKDGHLPDIKPEVIPVGGDPLTQRGGAWRESEVTAHVEDGSVVMINAGDAVDYMINRLSNLRQFLDCVNAN